MSIGIDVTDAILNGFFWKKPLKRPTNLPKKLLTQLTDSPNRVDHHEHEP